MRQCSCIWLDNPQVGFRNVQKIDQNLQISGDLVWAISFILCLQLVNLNVGNYTDFWKPDVCKHSKRRQVFTQPKIVYQGFPSD